MQSPNVVLKSNAILSFSTGKLVFTFSRRYPKQQRLLNLKKASVNQNSLPPSYLPYSSLSSLHLLKFDVILLDPPFSSSFTWDHLQELPIPSLAGDPSFVFLWVGSGAGEGLERGREILAKWGYRRCEDVVWVKTNNTSNQGPGVRNSILLPQRSVADSGAFTDRCTDYLSTYEDETALSHRHQRYRSTVDRQLVCTL